MAIKQLTVFVENRKGTMVSVTDILSKSNVNIRALSIAETSDYGLVRMIVDDSHKASSILLEHGDILSMTPVWAVEVPDRPAGLAELLAVLAEAGVEIPEIEETVIEEQSEIEAEADYEEAYSEEASDEEPKE